MDPGDGGDEDRMQQDEGRMRKEGRWRCLIVGRLRQQVEEGEALRWKARGPPPAARPHGGGSMMQQTIVLISSDHLGWVGLRTTLRAQEDLRLVGEAATAERAVQEVTRLQPDVIVTDTFVEGVLVVPLLTQLRTCCSQSTILVLGDDLDHAALVALANLEVAAYLAWAGLRPRVVLQVLRLVVEAGLRVSSPTAVAELLAPPERRRTARSGAVVLTAPERAVLKHLAAGRTREQIATAEGTSVRTVQRTIAALEDTFDAPSTFVLGMKAALQGFVS